MSHVTPAGCLQTLGEAGVFLNTTLSVVVELSYVDLEYTTFID